MTPGEFARWRSLRLLGQGIWFILLTGLAGALAWRGIHGFPVDGGWTGPAVRDGRATICLFAGAGFLVAAALVGAAFFDTLGGRWTREDAEEER